MEENKDKIKRKGKNFQTKPFAACNIARSF